MPDVTTLFKAGIAAAQSGDNVAARECFVQVVKYEPLNEVAWLWLSSVLPTVEQALKCLDHLLKINPHNLQVHEAKEILQVRQLLEEADLFKLQPAIAPATAQPTVSIRLGELLVEKGMLTPRELSRALAEQERGAINGKRPRLGEVLVNSQLLRHEQLEMAIRSQIAVVKQQSLDSPVTPVGRFLVERTYITADQLAHALLSQATGKQIGDIPKLGDVLIELGYLTRSQLDRALQAQREEFNSHFY